MNPPWPWIVLALLGAYHGLNPGMGWLFALSLGLQEKRRSARWSRPYCRLHWDTPQRLQRRFWP